MDERRYRRKTWVLVVLVLLALGYGSLLRYLPTITGSDLADGSIGVLLGLYMGASSTWGRVVTTGGMKYPGGAILESRKDCSPDVVFDR